MATSLLDRLETARRQRFVGRTAELELLHTAFNAAEFPFYVLHVFGPGGVGKTTLLHQFAFLARQSGVKIVYLDGRNVDPSPDLFLAAVQQSLGLTPPVSLFHFLASQNHRYIFLVDTSEMLAPLDDWLRDVFLPQLPGNVLTVLAGRHPPALGWLTDPGWQSLVHVVSLRNLSPEESQAYLQRRHVPAEQHKSVLDFTYGHPLALSLVADVYAQRPGVHFRPEEAPNVVKTLLEQLIEEVPSPAHRAALEACALVRLITEPLLAALLDTADAHDLFQWLRELSFVESDRRGLFPHDLAREALVADLRWRHHDWYMELHQRARNYYVAHLQRGDNQQQQRILSDYIFLHRDNPAVRPYFEWQESGRVFTDSLQPGDQPTLLEMVKRYEGPASADLAAHWLTRQPQGVAIVRDASGQPHGFLCAVAVDQASAADLALDPAVSIAHHYLENAAPLRPGETATYFRFWLAADSYQAVSPIQSRIFTKIVQHYVATPGLAYTFIPCAQPEFWAPVFAYASISRRPELDFEVDGRRYGLYAHDWRVMPPLAWLEMMGDREVGLKTVRPPLPAEQLVVLSQSDFEAAVREALRAFSQPNALLTNPLLSSRLVVDQTGLGAGKPERINALQNVLKTATDSLQRSPRQAKLYRAVYHTYLQPAATQEQAAELLDLPFSTFRRHLTAGVKHITDLLWQKEVGSLGAE